MFWIFGCGGLIELSTLGHEELNLFNSCLSAISGALFAFNSEVTNKSPDWSFDTTALHYNFVPSSSTIVTFLAISVATEFCADIKSEILFSSNKYFLVLNSASEYWFKSMLLWNFQSY